MNQTEISTKPEIIEYNTMGTCCKIMRVEILNDVIQDVQFAGGCPGNLIGIRSLVIGMNIDEVISKFSGTLCGDKNTSCPDQLAFCLTQYKSKKQSAKV